MTSKAKKALNYVEIALQGGEVISTDIYTEKADFDAFSSYVASKKQPQYSYQTFSVADELGKMKQLADAGAISAEEFEAFKKKLLNR